MFTTVTSSFLNILQIFTPSTIHFSSSGAGIFVKNINPIKLGVKAEQNAKKQRKIRKLNAG